MESRGMSGRAYILGASKAPPMQSQVQLTQHPRVNTVLQYRLKGQNPWMAVIPNNLLRLFVSTSHRLD